MSTEPEKKTFNGGCHCGKVRYEVSLALPPEPTAKRCNCTICNKTSATNLSISSPEDDFKLLTPASWDAMGDYQVTNKEMHKYFCPTCGVHVVGKGIFRFPDKAVDYFILNIATIDQPQEGIDLSTFKIRYMNGLSPGHAAEVADKPYPGGLA